MNILLINPPVRMRTAPYFPPVGLMIIASVLRGEHEVDVLDINTHRDGFFLPKKDYDLIGISGIISTYKTVFQLMPILRERYNCPIVIGGGGITSAPETYMEHIQPDYGVIGEGEVTIVELIEAIDGKRSFESVNGIITKDFRTPPRELVDINEIPSPAFDLFDMETYISNKRHIERDIPILATRGCPFNCNFCYHIFGRSFRYRKPKVVVDEMEHLMKEYGAESFLFGDECITANKKNLLALCQEIVDRGLNTRWICYSRVDTVDEEMMLAMKEAGCVKIGFGLESGSQRILDIMNKKVTVEKMIETYELADKIVGASATFIFGTPGEDLQSVYDSAYLQDRLNLSKNFFHLAPYPGTKFFEEHKDKILNKFGDMHNFLMEIDDAGVFVVNLTDWSDEEYHRIKDQLDAMIVLSNASKIGQLRLERKSHDIAV